jgi:hypothetical protein
MTRKAGGAQVESGYYLETRTWKLVHLAAEGKLPGGAQCRYLRVPWPVLLAAAPVLGGVFVVTYPIFGFAVMVLGLARKAAGAASEGARDLATKLAPGAALGEAHLTGTPPSGAPVEDERLEELEQEVARKRQPEK